MEVKQLNPKDYNLGSRLVLLQLSENEIAIVKKRKSRIIVKDGMQILEQANAIKEIKPEVKISIIILGNNICSKTVKLLSQSNIIIVSE